MTEQNLYKGPFVNPIIVNELKITFVGDAGVGKTKIIDRIVNNSYTDVYEPSLGIDFISKNIKYLCQNIKLIICDSSGLGKYKGLIPPYARNSLVVFLVYDISVKSSFDNIPKWITFIRNIVNTTIILCGNNMDLSNREVSKEEGEALAKNEGISFFEVYAKTDKNIKNMFYNIVANLLIFGGNNNNKQKIIQELMKENGVENMEEKEEEEKGIKIKEHKKEKCPLNQHKENDAISYCPECKIIMCIKCEKIHFELFQHHHQYTLLFLISNNLF